MEEFDVHDTVGLQKLELLPPASIPCSIAKLHQGCLKLWCYIVPAQNPLKWVDGMVLGLNDGCLLQANQLASLSKLLRREKPVHVDGQVIAIRLENPTITVKPPGMIGEVQSLA